MDVLVQVGTASAALRQKVEANAPDVLPGSELVGRVHFVALYFELHQHPVTLFEEKSYIDD